MTALSQFVLYNLLPALLGGLLAWAAIGAAIALLNVRHGKLRLCLFSAALLKSTLLLVGIGLVLPWPREVFRPWNAGALGPAAVVPFLLIATGIAVAGRALLARRARQAAESARDPVATAASARLDAGLDRVMADLERRRAAVAERCGCDPRLARPRVVASSEAGHSPRVITDEPATIVFPADLVERLDDDELDGALAHEIAHLQLRGPWSCFSSTTVETLSIANPMATIMASQLRREEEKACDDLAVAVTGDPEAYADMLLKVYRYARPRSPAFIDTLQHVPQLLGIRPLITERVERLLHPDAPGAAIGRQYAAFALIWIGIVLLFFNE